MRRTTLSIALAAFAAGAAPAGATTEVAYFSDPDLGTFLFVEGVGGRDTVRIRHVAARDQIVVSDPRGASGCVDLSRTVTSCPASSVPDFEVKLHGGDDALELSSTRPGSVAAASLKVLGGAGDDRIRTALRTEAVLDGGSGNDVLVGGPRHDALYGGTGRDRLLARGARDLLDGDDDRGARAPDVLVGGAGADTATYASARRPVVVDLRRGAGGVRRERDVLRSIERVRGGGRADRLIGDARANRLSGGYGADLLAGGAGRDLLVPGPGRDRPRCGLGVDTVLRPAPAELLAADCESVAVQFPRHDTHAAAPTVELGRGRMTLAAFCTDTGGCAARMRVFAFRSGRLVATAPEGSRPASSDADRATFPAALTAWGRRWLRRRGPHAVTVTISGCSEEDDDFAAEGEPQTFCDPIRRGWSVVLRR